MRAVLTAMLLALALPAAAQTPPFFTIKVAGTDNVYIFRYGNYQSMFVVTPAGVIATDPISENRRAAETYLAEIRKLTAAPVRYVVYSHYHSDRVAGGMPFKDAGAIFIAHKIAKDRLLAMARPDIVIPDETLETKRTLTLGGTQLELIYVGKNHSDNTLIMLLPKEKIAYAVDIAPIAAIHWRNMPDSYLPDWHQSLERLLALEWDRFIPGNPYAGGRLGTKADVRNLLAYMNDVSAEAKKALAEGRCTEAGTREIKLPKYASWTDYGDLVFNVQRYCIYHATGK